MVFGLVVASLVLILSIFAMILEGPMWRITLKDAILLSKYDCDDEKGYCDCSPGRLLPIIVYRCTISFSVYITL